MSIRKMQSRFLYFVLVWTIEVSFVRGAYVLHGSSKAATNPYSTLSGGNSFCKLQCNNDALCNGYSIDMSNNGCYLSSCSSYTHVPSCSTCYFASKSPITSPDLCTASTTTTTITPTTTTTPSTTTHTTTTPTTTTTLTPTDDVTQIGINTTSCICVCTEVNQTLEESIENRRRYLAVNQQGLSSTTRKLTSAPDIRVTSKVIGTMAIIILVVFGLFFFLGDIISVSHFIYTKLLNKSTYAKPM